MLLVGNGAVITRDPSRPFIRDGAVLCDGGLIREVGTWADLGARYPEAQFLDAKGGLIHPGLINAHMHYYSALVRGFGGKGGEPAADFVQVLERLWWRLDKALTLEDVKVSAQVCLLEAIRCGCTCMLDHHASPNAITGSLFAIAEAVEEMGLSACLCYEVSDRDGEDKALEGIRENRDFIQHASKGDGRRMAGTFGLHASLTLSDKTLDMCASSGDYQGFHVHVAEGQTDEPLCRERHGLSIVDRFRRFGLLGPKSMAIHCIHVDQEEMEILKDTRTAVVHNPESNMGNAVGAAKVLEMNRMGILMGLGTDGYVCDMLRSYAMANALVKHSAGHPNVGWGEIPTMLFQRNYEIANRYFSVNRGMLKEGWAADLVVFDYDPPTPLSDANVNGHLLFGPLTGHVVHTVADGKVLYKDRAFTSVDPKAIMARARELAVKVWERF
ncbi:putative aminohydrolase SsnA [Thermanaerovibrio acidaminovorans]|nr:putative aminohydrolase SsnA [Thermanaerovibrio acidaminovorans]